MFQINYNGMRKRDTHDEIVHSLETDRFQRDYLDRKGTLMINSAQVSAIRYGTALEVDEMNENINKNKIIESIVNQMALNTSTHHTYNTYTTKPCDGPPAPSVDHNIDDGLDKQKNKSRRGGKSTRRQKAILKTAK